jgi:RNA polymerase sigma factor (sigma-70 family)
MQVLYIRHRVRIYRHIVAIVGNEEVAEDLLSDTFLEVWRNAPRFRGQAAVATWLLAIARNKAISAIREVRRNRWMIKVAGELLRWMTAPRCAWKKSRRPESFAAR